MANDVTMQDSDKSSTDLSHQFALAAEHFEAGRCAEAEAVYRRLLVDRPEMADLYYNLGVILQKQGKLREAIQVYRRALALRPNLSEGWNNLGNVLHDLKEPRKAIEAYRRALALQPNDPSLYNNIGSSLRDLELPAQAIAAFRHGLTLRQDTPLLWNNLAVVLRSTGQIAESIACFDRGIALRPSDAEACSGRLYTLCFHPDYDAMAIHREARQWNDRFAQPFAAAIPAHDNSPSPNRRLRVGYVAPDFRGHCQSLFTVPLLACHDHAQFEIFCYSSTGAPDAATAVLRRSADQWRDIVSMPDPAVADLIRRDKIDILVDLTLHMGGNRLLVFARKPAPIQVTWLGYLGTTGLEAIDYRLTDPRLDPPGQSDLETTSDTANQQPLDKPDHRIGTQYPYYSEHTVRLPDTFWCYDPRSMYGASEDQMPSPGALPARLAGHVTFGCLNNFCKVTDGTLKLWARVLAALPDSHLVLLSPVGPHRGQVVQKLGVKEERIRFIPFQMRHPYLETYRLIDLCLDTFPYNGHTTSLDAFWMGVPVVTMVGRTVVGRAGWSQLHNLGLNDLVARSEDEFVKLAVDLAQDLDRLVQLRATLRQRIQSSPLMDSPRFARNIENAYRQMWQAWCGARA